jgi:hypothetical protein
MNRSVEEKVQILLDRLYQGVSTIEEEDFLRDYFSSNKDIPSHLLPDKEVFYAIGYHSGIKPSFDLEKEILSAISQSKFDQKKRKVKIIRLVSTWAAAASAVIVLGLGIFLTQNSKEILFADTYSDPYVAMQETQRVLALVGSKINLAQAEMQPLTRLSFPSEVFNPINEITKNLRHIEKINALNKPKEMPFIKHIFEESVDENDFYN